MDGQQQVLQALYDVVKDDAHPLQYNVSIRELLLRLKGNWQSEYLEALAHEQLIIIKRSETVVVQLTGKGLEKPGAYQYVFDYSTWPCKHKFISSGLPTCNIEKICQYSLLQTILFEI